MAWVEVLFSILGLLSIGITFIVVYTTRDKSKDIKLKPNMTKIDNLARREFTNGFTEGLLLKAIPRKNGCTLIEFFPTDIDQLDKKEEIQIQYVVVLTNCVKHLSVGEGSSRRNKMILVARSSIMLPEKMRGSLEEKWQTVEGQKAWLIESFGVGIPNGDQAVGELQKLWTRGHIDKNTMEHSREVNNKIVKNALDLANFKEDPKPTEQ